MAFLTLNYKSDALGMSTAVNVILPESAKHGTGTPYKTLYLLHGLTDDHTAWTRFTSIERYAAEYGIAVVMPSVGRNWYTDTTCGRKYFSFITNELPRVCRSYFCGMSDKREDNFIAGLSMGGYGAAKAALTYPDRYFGFASLSGAVDLAIRDRSRYAKEFAMIFGTEGGNTSALAGTANDPFHLAALYASEHSSTAQKMFIWCGTEDTLIESNRKFHTHLTALGIEHKYAESEGDHSWKWWDLHIKSALEYLLRDKVAQ